MISRCFQLIGHLSVPLMVGFLATLAVYDGMDMWYDSLEKPFFTPPASVFAPVWSVLYLLMGWSSYRVYQKYDGFGEFIRSLPAMSYAIQLSLNFSWTVIFFALREPGIAFIEILLLLGAISAMVWNFWKTDRMAGWLQLPYVVWTLFAAVLNAFIWVLNSF